MRRVLGFGILSMLLLVITSPGALAEGPSGELSAAGSTTVQPLAEKLSEAFMAVYPAVKIDVAGGGSSVGVKSAGTVDIGMASRLVKPSEMEKYPGLIVYTIAMDGIAIAVHPGVGVSELTREQVKDIFAGTIENWSEVGGEDKIIAVIAREEGSGTRTAFEGLVMGDELVRADVLLPSNGAIRRAVSGTEDAIGFLSFAYLDDATQAIAVDGVVPTIATAASGEYPVVRPLNMMTDGEGSELAQAFISYILSPDGQRVVSDEGYISVYLTDTHALTLTEPIQSVVIP